MKECLFPKLDGKIAEHFGTRGRFAAALGISENSLTAKMCGRRKWKSAEIERARDLLGINRDEVGAYFFA